MTKLSCIYPPHQSIGSRLLKWEPLNSCIMLLSLYSCKKEWALLLCPSLWRKIKQACQQSWLQGSYLADNFASRNIWKDCSIPEHNSGTKVTNYLWMIFVLELPLKILHHKYVLTPSTGYGQHSQLEWLQHIELKHHAISRHYYGIAILISWSKLICQSSCYFEWL